MEFAARSRDRSGEANVFDVFNPRGREDVFTCQSFFLSQRPPDPDKSCNDPEDS
jgi:hypothetical protein